MIPALSNLFFSSIAIFSAFYAIKELYKISSKAYYILPMVIFANFSAIAGYFPRSVYYLGNAFYGWSPVSHGWIIRYSQPFASASSAAFSIGCITLIILYIQSLSEKRSGEENVI